MNLRDEVNSAADLQERLLCVIGMLGSPSQADRICAVEILGRYGRDSEVAFLAIALNDRVEFVASHAAQGLANVNTDAALVTLCRQFEADLVERPHYLSHAIAQFGGRGLEALIRYAGSPSPTLRYFASRGLGETGAAAALPILEQIADSDSEVTSFGALVSTGAKKGLSTWHKINSAD